MRPLPEVHRDALAATGRIVAGIKPDQLHAPTPCDDYDVAGLLNHLIGGNFWVAPLVEGKTIAEVGDALDRDFSLEEYDTSAEEANAAFSGPGAMQKPVGRLVRAGAGRGVRRASIPRRAVHGWTSPRRQDKTRRSTPNSSTHASR